jgi:Putative inner membrane protein (DUF1819)
MVYTLDAKHPSLVMRYSAFTNQGFLLREVCLIAEMLLCGYDLQKIKIRVLEEDLFQLSSLHSRKTILSAVLKRLEDTGQDLWECLSEGSLELRCLTNLYLILLKHRLLRDFIAEVLLEELLRFRAFASRSEINAFFERKYMQVDEIAAWSEATLRKSRNNILTICSDAGLLDGVSVSSLLIVPQLVPVKLKQLLLRSTHEALLPLLLDRGND